MTSAADRPNQSPRGTSLADMLTEPAQPTSHVVYHARSRLSAAGSALLVIAALLSLTAPPAGASPATGAAAKAGHGAWPWPLLGEVVTPYRNGSDRYAAGQHRGLDIAAPVGTRVLAIVDGRVSFSGRLPDGGETVTVTSADGRWLISNLHLSRRIAARGDTVRAGSVLGRTGTSGRRSAAASHLHLGVRRAADGAYVDPATLLGARRLPPSPAGRAEPSLLERPSVRPNNVHAQSTGDSTPAERHRARSRQVTAVRPAGTNAREGHAADGISRVAPPPVRVDPVARPEAARTATLAAPAATPVRRDVQSAASSRRPRMLLIAVALVCLLALLLRRGRPGADSAADPPAAPTEHRAGEAVVLQFDESRRSA